MTLSPNLYKKICHYATFPQTSVSIRQMVKFGQNPSLFTLLAGTQFLKDELPVRLAHRVVELENLPHGLSRMPSIEKVKNWYVQSFQDLIEFPTIALPKHSHSCSHSSEAKHTSKHCYRLPESQPNLNYDPFNTQRQGKGESQKVSIPLAKRYYIAPENVKLPRNAESYEKEFVHLIDKIKRRHDSVVPTVAQGILEYKEYRKQEAIDTSVQEFLDRFYLSRIGIRMLIGQHIALNKRSMPDYVGVVCTRTNVRQVAQDAIDNARFICEDHYGLFSSPKVNLYCSSDLTFMYVPSHLHHMVFELLKNSLRAVVESKGIDCESYPSINLIVAEGEEDITIKISDEGGGIPRSSLPMVWTYMYTTAEKPALDHRVGVGDFKAPLAGYGYGLPISRLYARYFGGDLRLISMEGYGTDAYLHLSRLSDSEEPLM